MNIKCLFGHDYRIDIFRGNIIGVQGSYEYHNNGTYIITKCKRCERVNATAHFGSAPFKQESEEE